MAIEWDDHEVDEDWEPSSCEAEIEECSGDSFPGMTRCMAEDGEVCEPTEYCRYDFDEMRFYGNADDCGWGNRNCETGGHADCPPSTFCFVNNCWPDATGMPFYGCWPIAEPHPVCPGSTYYTENTSCSGSTCWNPGELGGGLECP